MENQVLVKVENVSKKFCKDLKLSLWYGAIDIVRKSLGLPISEKLRKKEFWAVKDVNFELKRGECIGLIGHNGAGKSSLLKVLNGLYAPDKGKITMNGKVGALIELGAGFNPILTGRENIYNNAAILGFSKEQVDENLQEIIDFSEIEEFLDTPVKNYSSGMKVRLGFAVAAFMDPDILIVDEVLAVGDLSFRMKCFKKLDEILPHTAVIFVSHNMSQISRMCSTIILMDHGKVEYHGEDVSKGIELYYGKTEAEQAITVFNTGEVDLISFEFTNLVEKDVLPWNTDLEVKIKLKVNNASLKKTPSINIVIFDKEDRNVAVVKGLESYEKLENNSIEYKVTIPKLQLSQGRYYFNISVSEEIGQNPLLRINYAKTLQVTSDREIWPAFYLDSNWKIQQML